MKNVFFVFFLFLSTFINAQTTYLIIDKNIRLPKDSVEQSNLTRSINDFLLSIKDNKEFKKWIISEEQAETQVLVNEIQGFVNNDSITFKPYLIGCELLSDKKAYSVQVVYISLIDSQPQLSASFEFIVHKKDGNFLFSSPLLRKTRDWHTITEKNLVFHYQNKNTENLIKQYLKYIKEYDNILGVTTQTEYYFCDDCESMTQMLQMAGIQYKVNYNGLSWNGISFVADGKIILLQTQRQSRQTVVDPHYIFHFRAEVATSQNTNYYMICAAANVYSGCWDMSWAEIKRLFKEKMMKEKKQDWLQLYFDRYNFGESKAKYIFVTTFINGLLIEKADKEQGIDAVKKLLASGDMYKNKANFFKILEDITGVNEANFNKEVGKIINESMKNI